MFGLDFIAFWIIATGILVSLSGAILGCFLVLRRMSLLGDAISHAVLPGIAVAFIVSGARNPLVMLAGALVAGLITTTLIQAIHRYTNVAEDAAMGVVFTSMFAIGVIAIAQAASHVDLDVDCVLYGVLEMSPLDTVPFLGMDFPRVALNLGATLAAVLVFVVALWKELRLVCFDPELATSLGFNADLVHYGLMSMVALVTVTAFEAVGSILIVAMFIAPAAAASFLTHRLSSMVLAASGIGVLSAISGRFTALWLGTSAASMMAVCAGGFFLLAAVFAPGSGLLSRRWSRMRLSMRIVREDILGLLYRAAEETTGVVERHQILAAVGGDWMGRAALWELRREGKIAANGDRLSLTRDGERLGATLVRSHRMWETFLTQRLEFPADHVHNPADRVEHFLGPDLRAMISNEIAEEEGDPHGREIPKDPES